jgi:hypothetical protein
MTDFKTIRVVEFLPETLKGGTTRPLVALGEDGNPYVLKLFNIKDASQRSYTAAEAFAYIIAKAFDLKIPDCVLMTVPNELLSYYKTSNPDIYNILLNKDLSKPSFGSFYFSGLPTYSPTINDNTLDIDEFESIYAFDLLILNEDRRKIKPNILRSKHYLIIDHEKAFEGTKYAKENFNTFNLPNYYRNHLFFEILCRKEKKKPNSVTFETFFEYLRSLDTRKLEEEIEYLISLGFDDVECYDWLYYIFDIKKNSSKFVSLLKKSIQQ